jgi:hypothetical protein
VSREREREVLADLQRANGPLLYVEGKTDRELFAAFLGREATDDWFAVRDVGGRQAVELRVGSGLPGVHGLTDSDGDDGEGEFSDGAMGAEGPRRASEGPGPLHRWPAYDIEAWLIQHAPWPEPWGPSPDWMALTEGYDGVVAWNRMALRDTLAQLRGDLGGGQQVPPRAELRTALEEVARALPQEVRSFDTTADVFLGRPLPGRLRWLSGKPLLRRATGAVGKRPSDWTRWIREHGGLPEIRAWWRRVGGNG